ncbi:hypothetical protein AB7952_16790 [Streptomyces sp. PG2]|jgi:hypothetical protein
MRIRGTTLRLTAVSTLVVLALTGFSSRHGGHGHGHSGGSGGGCSSSSQDHDSSSSSSSSGGVSKDDYDSGDDDSYGSGSYGGGSGGYRYRDRYHDDDDDNRGGGGKAKSLDDATVELLDCANGSRPYTKVLVTNPNGRKATFTVTVVLRADRDRTLDTVRTKVEVPANGAVTAKVRPSDRSLAAEVEECAPEPRAPQAR